MKKMNPVIHFEMPYKNAKQVADFYAKAFGWKHQTMDSKMGNYIVVTTTESDDKGPKKPGAINGGFFPKDPKTSQVPSVVIAVDDINDHVKIVKSAGGKVLGKPMEIPGVGRYVSFLDTEGNRVGMLQASR
ncbi:MAG: VOC family protein [Patescibacteria group bacterium]